MIGSTRRLSPSSSALPRSAAYLEKVPSSNPPASPTVQLLMRAALSASSMLTGLLGIGRARFGAGATCARFSISHVLCAEARDADAIHTTTKQQSTICSRATSDLPPRNLLSEIVPDGSRVFHPGT